MFDKFKNINILKWRKAQNEIKKQLEQLFVVVERSGIKVVVRGDKKIEKLEIDGQDNKVLREIINDAMKEMEKKTEKHMRGQTDILKDLGIPGV